MRGAAARRVLVAAAAVVLGACAGIDQRDDPRIAALPARVELAQTPFHPQEDFQCGPAALATVLEAAGLAVTPEQLVPQVYVPARQGSLQAEMLAAARRNGALAVVLEPRLDALLAELAAGNPVLVLLNLGLSWAPSWHYAVAVGYESDARVMILRSGTMRRQEMGFATFEQVWGRSGHWAFVALPPGRLPATGEGPVTQALLAYARVAAPADALRAYAAALARWPASLALLTGTGNAAVAADKLDDALETFATAARLHPESGAAQNNHAAVLLALGRLREARDAVQRAVDLGGPWRDAALDTLKEIDTRAAGAGR